MKSIAIGDKVAYSVQFLRSIGEVSGDMPAARGVVTALDELAGGKLILARIDWDREMPGRVNVRKELGGVS